MLPAIPRSGAAGVCLVRTVCTRVNFCSFYWSLSNFIVAVCLSDERRDAWSTALLSAVYIGICLISQIPHMSLKNISVWNFGRISDARLGTLRPSIPCNARLHEAKLRHKAHNWATTAEKPDADFTNEVLRFTTLTLPMLWHAILTDVNRKVKIDHGWPFLGLMRSRPGPAYLRRNHLV